MKRNNDKSSQEEIKEAVEKICTMIEDAIKEEQNKKKEKIIDKFNEIGLSVTAEDIKNALNKSEDKKCENCEICQQVDDEPERWGLSLREIIALTMAAHDLVDGMDDPVVDDFKRDLFGMMDAEGYVIMKEVDEYDE